MVDWTSIFQTIRPMLVNLLQRTITDFGTPTAPPAAPAPSEIPPGAVPHPSDAIKALQKVLNAVVIDTPPVAEDGWLGPKTEAKIMAGIAKLKTYGVG